MVKSLMLGQVTDQGNPIQAWEKMTRLFFYVKNVGMVGFP